MSVERLISQSIKIGHRKFVVSFKQDAHKGDSH